MPDTDALLEVAEQALRQARTCPSDRAYRRAARAVVDALQPYRLALCEGEKVFLRPGVPYVFEAVEGCAGCQRHLDAYSE